MRWLLLHVDLVSGRVCHWWVADRCIWRERPHRQGPLSYPTTNAQGTSDSRYLNRRPSRSVCHARLPCESRRTLIWKACSDGPRNAKPMLPTWTSSVECCVTGRRSRPGPSRYIRMLATVTSPIGPPIAPAHRNLYFLLRYREVSHARSAALAEASVQQASFMGAACRECHSMRQVTAWPARTRG